MEEVPVFKAELYIGGELDDICNFIYIFMFFVTVDVQMAFLIRDV